MRRGMLAIAARLALVAVAVAVAVEVAPAHADPDPADLRFRAATARAGAGDLATALADFLAIADELPDSPWADDALAEAARLAERAGDLSRARALLDRLVARYPDSRSTPWARAHAAELATRAAGGWTEVAAAHDRVIAAAGRPGDPTPHLVELEALIRAHPGYPRGAAARIWLGDAWTRQGDGPRALGWYRDAAATAPSPEDRRTARLREVGALVALDRFAGAEAVIAELAADPAVDPFALERARDELDRGRGRHRWRIAAWIALALLAAAGVIRTRRATGSTRATLAALARPPIEVGFLIPIAALVVAVAASGNVLVAHAVRFIAIGGVAVTWLSGAVLRAAPPDRRQLAVHLAAITVAATAIVYLAISGDQLLDLLLETWRHGPEAR